MSLYPSPQDFVYQELRAAAESTGAFISDEADEDLLRIAETLAHHPVSEIVIPDHTIPNDTDAASPTASTHPMRFHSR